jgi:hypothetical protein
MAVEKGIPKRATSWECKGYSMILESYDDVQKNLPVLDYKFIYDIGEEYLYYVHVVIDAGSRKAKSTRPMRIGRAEANESDPVDPVSFDWNTVIEEINEYEGTDVIQYFTDNFGDVLVRFIDRGSGDLVVDVTDPDSGRAVRYRMDQTAGTIVPFENSAFSRFDSES